MKKVVFSKYNRTRKKEYRISTSIVETPEGKFVEKRPLGKESEAHIAHLLDNSRRVEGTFPNIHVLQPKMTDGVAVYPFLEGQTLDAELAMLLETPEQLMQTLKEKNEVLFAGPQGTVCPANVDMIYDNLMDVDGKWYCVDCEWVSDTPLPVEFLKYRSLHYFYTKYRKQLGKRWTEKAFLEEAGIDPTKIESYENTEKQFQQMIRGEDFEFDDRKGVEKPMVDSGELFQVREYQQRIRELQQEEQERNDHIRHLDEHIQHLDNYIRSANEKIERKTEECNHYQELADEQAKELQQKEALIRSQENDLYRLAGDVSHLNELAHIKDNEIADRIRYAQDLEAIIAKMRRNPVYRVSRVPAKIVRSLFPRGSRKRKILGYIKHGILQPKNVWLTAEARNRTYGDIMLGEGYKEHGKVHLPKVEHPLVSIVIPVYNQVCYTYNCLLSIAANTGDIPYEVIIADDVSTDATRKLAHFAENLVISRNSKNMGFLKNCNQAAAKARGEYIFFLNNDTTVGENWLRPLVDLMERRQDAGMVGSKLVYPDGKLQEAGGIIWKDGSGWNFGRGQDPDMPEYNYVKEVDYISGAAIMIRSSLWKEIGGFDETFAPAYYEDTDLAFQVRQKGYKVLYQPQSVVTHFEGVSNGTDLNSGLKKYQVDNAEKFRKKWAEVLDHDHAEGPEQLFVARDRSQNRKVVLFIDHYVPHFDKDAGSKSTFAYVKAFLGHGFSVKFIGDNYFKHEPYTTVLQQMGVEVLYGNWYALHWRDWIAENGQYFDIAFMERPHITIKYIDFFREHSKGKILYYGHDLHYVREMREYAITHDPETKTHAQKMRVTEYECMRKSDVVYYPSYVEVEEIARNDASICARAIPVYVYEKPNDEPCKDIHERKDIMFVGGFAHAPNADAVKWFVQEIFPKILKAYPDIKFYIMGSNPPEEILAMNSDSIIVKGFVTDEELDTFYRKCRLDVVPLRYGAGMKGKVIEAMYNKIPLITTPIGAEGLKEFDEVMCVHEDADAFAECVISLYEDYDRLDTMISHMPEFIEKYFSLNAAMNIIGQDIN